MPRLDRGLFLSLALVQQSELPTSPHGCRQIIDALDVHRDRWQPLERHGPGIRLISLSHPERVPVSPIDMRVLPL